MKTSQSQGSSPKPSVAPRRLSRVQLGLLALLLLVGSGVVIWRTITPASEPASSKMAQALPPGRNSGDF
jgi:hypothetical protein